MKALRWLYVVGMVFMFQMPGLADPSGVSIVSPDRPRVWYNPSGDKLTQYLEWSPAQGQLILHVAYANVGDTTAAWSDQYYLDSFQLAFPSVHLDSSRNRLYVVTGHGHQSEIGHLEPGVMGDRVVLDDHYQLSAHRRNGVVEAAIKPVSEPGR